jgi:hypothetical protein
VILTRGSAILFDVSRREETPPAAAPDARFHVRHSCPRCIVERS